MEPSIRYAKSADGVSIAYWAIGEGRPLVYMPAMPFSHIEREWAIPEWRRRYERLAEGRRLVRYDARGFGLSEPNPTGVTLASHAADLEAVLDALAIDDCDLFASGDSGMVAIEFCTRTPARVGRLILWGSYTNREPLSSAPVTKSMRALWDQDWVAYTESAVRMIFQWKHNDRASQIAEFYRAGATQDSIRNVIALLDGVDVTSLLPNVHVPTLVVGLDGTHVDLKDEARRLAAGLPNAELRIVRSESLLFDFYDSTDAVLTVVNDFLGGGAPGQARPGDDRTPAIGGLRTVLFTDLVGHTEMMQRLGDDKGRDILREHERITRETLKEFDGAEVKTMGDGFMASFGSVTKAMDCAIALQRAFAAWNDRSAGMGREPVLSEAKEPLTPDPGGEVLAVRVGLNAGEPIEEYGDLFGSTVILASRIAAQAGAGEILIPEPLRHLLSGKSYVYADRGDVALKGFEDAVRLYEVRWRAEGLP